MVIVVSACDRGPGASCAKARIAVIDNPGRTHRGSRITHDVIHAVRIDEPGVCGDAVHIEAKLVGPVDKVCVVLSFPHADPRGARRKVEDVVVALDGFAVARYIDGPARIHPDDVVREVGLGGSVFDDDRIPDGLIDGIVRHHVVLTR